MRRILFVLMLSGLVPSVASAQNVDAAFKVVTITDTTARALMVGCTVGSVAQCTGGINAGPISVDSITGTGVLSITEFSASHLLTGSGDGPMTFTIANTNSGGTATSSGLRVQTELGPRGLSLRAFGSSYTTSGQSIQSGALVEADGAGGLALSASNAASGRVRFYTADVLRGTMSETGSFDWQGTLGVVGNFAVNTSSFTVNASSGNTAIAGTLGVTGDVAVATNKFTVAASTGNTAVAGTLAVTGTTTQAAVNASGLYTLTRGATSTPGLGGWAYVNTGATAGGSFRVDGGSDFNIDMYTGAAWANVAQFTDNGNFKLGGTATRAGTAGTAAFHIFNGTNPAGTLANGVSFYSNAGEATVMDAAGNATPISPHDDETNEVTFQSKNTVTGKVLRVELERMWRAVDALLGGGFIDEYVDADPARPLPNVKRTRIAELGQMAMIGWGSR